MSGVAAAGVAAAAVAGGPALPQHVGVEVGVALGVFAGKYTLISMEITGHYSLIPQTKKGLWKVLLLFCTVGKDTSESHLRWTDLMNLLWQTGQMKFFSPVCVRVWRASSSLRANRFPQPDQWQGNGRSPEGKRLDC